MSSSWRRGLPVLLLGLVGACAGGTAPPVAAPESTLGAVPTTVAVAGGKPTPPIELAILLDGHRIVPRTPFTATVSWAPRAAAPAARTRVASTGAVTVLGGAGEWKDVVVGRTLTVPVQLTVTASGPGEVRATVELLDGAGQVRDSRTSVLYVLATGPDVLTGTVGTLDLQLRQLDADRAAGRVSEADYARLKERILGGGAIETRN